MIKHNMLIKVISVFMACVIGLSGTCFAQGPVMGTLAVQSPFKPIVEWRTGIRTVIEFSMKERGDMSKAWDERKQAFWDEIKRSDVYRRCRCSRELANAISEGTANSYDSFIDRIEWSGIKAADFTGMLILEAFYEGDEFVLNIIDNGRTIKLEKDGRPFKRYKEARHFGGVKGGVAYVKKLVGRKVKDVLSRIRSG